MILFALFFLFQNVAAKKRTICRVVSLKSNSGVLSDSLMIDWESIQLPSELIDSAIYNLRTSNIHVYADRELDSIEVCYELFPFTIEEPPLYPLNDYDSLTRPTPLVFEAKKEERSELFRAEGINKSGNITRGVTSGNSGSNFVNSNMNIQLSGEIGDGVMLTGVLSDQDVPFEPEGNSQSIQEFDNIYLQVEKDDNLLRAGDVLLNYQEDGFLKYRRNVQGGYAEVALYKDSLRSVESSLGVAVSKGKFALNILEAIEGVQGPYRLRGARNERFIIILSGSERVYLDGKLLTRGWDNDYTIDYNTAEITFNPQVMITQFSRLRVDFEYADKNYLRTTTVAEESIKLNKINVDVHYYSEKDSRNQPLNITLSNNDKVLLSNVGDDFTNALIPSFDTATYTEGQVYYTTDTLLEEVFFVLASPGDSLVYEVSFSNIGEGLGDYDRIDPLSNVATYYYVGKDNGSYVAKRLTPLPQLKRVIDTKVTYSFHKNGMIYTEMAVSDHDLNLFSEIDDDDNNGLAASLGFKWDSISRKPGENLYSSFHTEFVGETYRPIDRFRSIEFNRDWNVDEDVVANSFLTNAVVGWNKGRNEIEYSFSYRNVDTVLSGIQNKLHLKRKIGKLDLSSQNFYMLAKGEMDYSWFRSQNELSHKGKFFNKGVLYNTDQNVISQESKVLDSKMYFGEYGAFVASSDSSNNAWRLQYVYREDSDTLSGDIKKGLYSHNVRGESSFGFTNNKIKIAANYRQLDGRLKLEEQVENSVSGVLSWNSTFFQRVVRSTLKYANAVSRELQKEFVYTRVALGLGNYVYNDYNNNGLQELDEFVSENTYGDYIKVWVPTDIYINAFENKLNYKLALRLPTKWMKASGVKSFAYRFSNQSSLNTSQKYAGESLRTRINPLANTKDEEILSSYRNIKSTLFFNKGNKPFSSNAQYLYSERKQLLNGGFQFVSNEKVNLSNRIKIKPILFVNFSGFYQVKESSSDLLVNNNFYLDILGGESSLSWQPSNHFRVVYNYELREKNNHLGSEQVGINGHSFEVKLLKPSRYTISSKIKYLIINDNKSEDFRGTIVGYEMYEGLNEGNNYEWQIVLQKTLLKGLQFQLRYQLRKPSGSSLIQLGSIQVSALI